MNTYRGPRYLSEAELFNAKETEEEMADSVLIDRFEFYRERKIDAEIRDMPRLYDGE